MSAGLQINQQHILQYVLMKQYDCERVALCFNENGHISSSDQELMNRFKYQWWLTEINSSTAIHLVKSFKLAVYSGDLYSCFIHYCFMNTWQNKWVFFKNSSLALLKPILSSLPNNLSTTWAVITDLLILLSSISENCEDARQVILSESCEFVLSSWLDITTYWTDKWGVGLHQNPATFSDHVSFIHPLNTGSIR